MATTPPPSRYRVVERGRRLVVIDTQTGQPATRERAADATVAAPIGPERIAFDGRSTLVTRSFYDNKAPRRLTLDEGTTRLLENARTVGIGAAVLAVVLAVFFPWLAFVAVAAGVALVQGRNRAAIRRHVTAWLDRFDAADG